MMSLKSKLKLNCKRKKPNAIEPDPVDPIEHEALNEERYTVDRQIYNHTKFEKEFQPAEYSGFSFRRLMRDIYAKNLAPSKVCAKKQLYNRVPAIKWLRSYKIKDYLLADFLAGITVGIMHIPQGMAYSLLASMPPIYGLYTSFFPSMIYWLFGTSKQISIGTFAVVSLMVAANLANLEPTYVPPVGFDPTNITIDTSNFLSLDREKARVMIITAQAFWVGIIQIGLFFLQFGFITSYLVESFLNGFLTGCAVHVGTSQLKFLFGVKLTGYVGAFKIPKTYIEFFSKKIPLIHVPSMIISIICVTFLLILKIHVNERFAKKMLVPVPIELIVVIFGTLISFLAKLSDNYHVNVIGYIPSGIPGPTIPPLFLIKDMILSCFLTAIVAYAINFSLADLFAKKHRYKINTTQEFLAAGATNVFSSFFPCFTTGASLARSCVQDNAGGKTQLVSLVSCVLLGLVLLFIAPLFRELPQACLASIIVVALKNLLLQVTQLPYYWKVNKTEFWLFLVSLLSVVILDVDLGLGIGVAFYILAHIVRSTQPYATLLGHIPGTEIYKDTKLYKNAHQLKDIKIVRIQQELHATNAAVFKKSIYELIGIKPQEVLHKMKKIEDLKQKLAAKNQPFSLYDKMPNFMKKCLPEPPTENKKETISSFENPAFENSESVNKQATDLKQVTQQKNENNYYTEYEIQEKKTVVQTGLTEYDLYSKNKINKNVKINGNEVNLEMEYNDDIVPEYSSASESSDEEEEYNKGTLTMPKMPIKFLIIDFSPINFIDTVGVKTVRQLVNDFNDIGIRVYLAECNDAVRNRFKMMEQTPFNHVRSKYLDDNILHISIHDAVLHAEKVMVIKKRAGKFIRPTTNVVSF